MSKYKLNLKDGRSIVLLYVKNFQWYNKEDQEVLKGHPYSGRVYRAVKSDDENAYYVKIDGDKLEEDVLGIRIVDKAQTTENWTAEIEELNDENITDFDIDENDYLKIGNWLESSHKDFTDLINKINVNSKAIELPITKDMTKEQILSMVNGMINNFSDKVTDSIQELSEIDPMQLEAIDDYLSFVLSEVKKEDQDMISLSREMSLHSKYGKGANLYSAIFHLEQYLRPNNKSSKQDLLKAMQAICYELIRLKIWLENNGK